MRWGELGSGQWASKEMNPKTLHTEIVKTDLGDEENGATFGGNHCSLPCWTLQPTSSYWGKGNFRSRTGWKPQSHPGLWMCQTSKAKQSRAKTTLRREKKSGKLFSMPTSSEESQDQRAACHRRDHGSLMLWPTSQRSGRVLCHFPAVCPTWLGPNRAGPTLYGNTVSPPGAWIPAFDYIRAGLASFPLVPTFRKPATAAGYLSHPIRKVAAFQW